MRIWFVYSGEGEDYQVDEVFTNQERAEEYCALINKHTDTFAEVIEGETDPEEFFVLYRAERVHKGGFGGKPVLLKEQKPMVYTHIPEVWVKENIYTPGVFNLGVAYGHTYQEAKMNLLKAISAKSKENETV